MKYILALDQGTSSSRAVIYDENFKILGHAQHAFPQYFPQNGWVEHDLKEIWQSVEASILGAIAHVQEAEFSPEKIISIGITNQRETFGLWDRKSHAPLGRAIVWQCRRSSDICAKLKKSAAGRKVAKDSGLLLDPYFSGTKLKWWLDHDPLLRKRARKGEIAFGTMDSFLVWKLTNGEAHVTDVSNASRTLLMDLKTLQWSPHALKTLKIPAELLPNIQDSDAFFGVTKNLNCLPDNIPISGILGDQQAALFGQACFASGEAKLTYGTGAFLLMNTGSAMKRSRQGLTTIAWRAQKKTSYALEGSVFIAGAAVQWLRDGLNVLQTSSEIEELAKSVKDSDGVFFIPALSGLGSPYWRADAKGLIGGLTRGSTRAHLARACLEGIAASIADLFSGLEKDFGKKIKKLRVDGGAATNDLLLQAQANLLRCEIGRPLDLESTARGAAYMAALGVGLIQNTKDLETKNPPAKVFKSLLSVQKNRELLQLWRRRVKALLSGAY